jgi:hypothetical protein
VQGGGESWASVVRALVALSNAEEVHQSPRNDACTPGQDAWSTQPIVISHSLAESSPHGVRGGYACRGVSIRSRWIPRSRTRSRRPARPSRRSCPCSLCCYRHIRGRPRHRKRMSAAVNSTILSETARSAGAAISRRLTTRDFPSCTHMKTQRRHDSQLQNEPRFGSPDNPQRDGGILARGGGGMLRRGKNLRSNRRTRRISRSSKKTMMAASTKRDQSGR